VAPEAWSWVAPGGRIAVVARTLSDEGDDPRLIDRVGPPVSEREAMAESDKQSRRRPKRTSRTATGRLGQTGREEVGRGWAGK
jgi:hypothetical protein